MAKRIQFYLSDEAADVLSTVENKSKHVNDLILQDLYGPLGVIREHLMVMRESDSKVTRDMAHRVTEDLYLLAENLKGYGE